MTHSDEQEERFFNRALELVERAGEVSVSLKRLV